MLELALGLILYVLVATVVLVVTAIEQSHRYSQVWGVRIDDVMMGCMAGALLGAVWPVTIVCFLLMDHSRPHTAMMCTLTGGHNWRPIGGIPFRGIEGIYRDGSQGLWCMRCPSKKHVWPWGDEQFSADETFGYSRRAAT